MTLPTIKQLRYICALAQAKHFGKAAEACFVSQSALSTAINELEQNLGVTLFERDSKHVMLTPIGSSLVERAQSILNEVDDFVFSAEQAQKDYQDSLRLGVIPTIAPFCLPKILNKLRQQSPNLKLLIREDLSSNLLNLLQQGELDLLLFALPYDTSGFETHELFDDKLVLCLPKQHALCEQQDVTLTEMLNQDILLLEDGHCLRDQTLSACSLNPKDISIPYQGTSLSTVVQMVANNIGITLLPDMAIKANIAHGTDIEIRNVKSNPIIARKIALVWRNKSPRKDEFRNLGELIKQLF